MVGIPIGVHITYTSNMRLLVTGVGRGIRGSSRRANCNRFSLSVAEFTSPTDQLTGIRSEVESLVEVTRLLLLLAGSGVLRLRVESVSGGRHCDTSDFR